MPIDISKPALVIHGGAWSIEPSEKSRLKRHLSEAVQEGWASLLEAHSAIDVAESVIRKMEDSGAFDAGKGAVLNAQGEVELDAMIMNGDLTAGQLPRSGNSRIPSQLQGRSCKKHPT